MSDPIATTTGAEAAQPAAAAETQPATLLGGVAAQTDAGTQSALATGAAAAAPDAALPATKENFFPEKFLVKTGEDVDFDASARKMAEAYGNLEKRIGSGEIRPANTDGYSFDLGEEFATAFKASPEGQKFLSDAFEHGMTNKQMNFMVNELARMQPSEAEKVTGVTPAQATEQLQAIWKEPSEFNRNMVAADTAARNLLKDDYPQFIGRYGNDPAIIRLLATVGSEMGEDSLRLAGTPTVSADSIDSLMMSEAYNNKTHPDHNRVTGQVRTYFARTAGTQPLV